jgi:tRNA nucleotidyltransferase (CCA-adding enzyme)
VAKETIKLMSKIHLQHLSAERVFEELKKALSASAPRRFFEVLKEANKLSYWFPEVENLIGVPTGPKTGKHEFEVDTFEHTMNVISGIKSDPVLRFAGLCHDFGKALSEAPPKHHGHDEAGVPLVKEFCKRLKVPLKFSKAAVLFTEEHLRMHRILNMRPGKAVGLIEKISKIMKLEDFLDCSVGDGTTQEEKCEVLKRAELVLNTKLPEKYRDRGKLCKDILTQIRGEVWKN